MEEVEVLKEMPEEEEMVEKKEDEEVPTELKIKKSQ